MGRNRKVGSGPTPAALDTAKENGDDGPERRGEQKAVTRARGLLNRAGSLMSDQDRRLVVYLVLFTLALRVLSLMMIHTGADERDYWFSAKRLLLGLPYDVVQHRTVRFTIVLPVLAVQALFGTHPNVYYVVPLVLSAVQVALIYRLGVALQG